MGDLTSTARADVWIDGSQGEGGGQVLRSACTLAAVTGRTVRIERIRAGRSNPGLRAQHLVAVNAAGSLCGAEILGAEVGSSSLEFRPRGLAGPGEYRFDIGTAGSTTLVLQTVFPLLGLVGGGRVTVTGGTHNPMAPTAEYLARVFAPVAGRMGWPLAVSMERAGFYPKGGGVLTSEVGAAVPAGVVLPESSAGSVSGHVLTANLPGHVGERGLAAVSAELGCGGEVVRAEAVGAGAAVSVLVEGEIPAGFSALGERGKPMERVVAEAAEAYRAWGGVGVDEHLADQLVTLAALGSGETVYRASVVSGHLETVLEIVKAFGCPVAEVDGAGWVRVVGGLG